VCYYGFGNKVKLFRALGVAGAHGEAFAQERIGRGIFPDNSLLIPCPAPSDPITMRAGEGAGVIREKIP
jgi:hypothetical protein